VVIFLAGGLTPNRRDPSMLGIIDKNNTHHLLPELYVFVSCSVISRDRSAVAAATVKLDIGRNAVERSHSKQEKDRRVTAR
jgi:hypothetical protein